MKFWITGFTLFCFVLTPFAQNADIEEGVKQVEEILNRIDNCAFLYVVKKETAKSGAAFKRLALHARGPVKCGEKQESTLRVGEHIQWLEPSKNPIKIDRVEEGFGGASGNNKLKQLTHNVSFYDGTKTYAWNDQTNGVQIKAKFNFYQLLTPPSIFSVIETRFFSPLQCTFDAYRKHNRLNEDIFDVKAYSTRIHLTITEGKAPNLMRSHYFIDREKGIERSSMKAAQNDSQDIGDEFQQINGVWVPKKGRFINRRVDETTTFEVLNAKVNDPSVAEALKPFDHKNPKWNEKRSNASLPWRDHPTYVQSFFGLTIQEAMQMFLEN